jgi:putative ATP-dependent endonuclease of OLD family
VEEKLSGRSYSADNVKEVRNVLGVRLDDNLSSAQVVLIVEGEEDRIALTGILSAMDAALARELKTGRVAIDVLGGAGNLVHRIRLHTEAMCDVHAFLDHDVAGRQAFDAAKNEGVIKSSAVNFALVGGKTESELEDLYDEAVFSDILQDEIGLAWISGGPDKNKKWAERVRNLLRRGGKPMDEGTLLAIKIKVAAKAASLGLAALHQSKKGPIESLCNSLKSRLEMS